MSEMPSESGAFVVRTPIGALKVYCDCLNCNFGGVPKIRIEYVHHEGNIPLATVEYKPDKKSIYTNVFGDMYQDDPTAVVCHDGLNLL